MIDQAIRPELEELLRATLEEMIPKVAAARAASAAEPATDLVVVRRDPFRPARRARRFAVAALAAVAAIVGLVVVVTRDADRSPSTGDAAALNGEPAWYRLLRPTLPEGFDRAALTFVSDTQIWFVAINETDGKALEIQLTTDVPQLMSIVANDATGRWEETPQGYNVVTPDLMMVTVSCDIGAQGRDFPGPPNYCDLPSSGAPRFTKPQIRDVAVQVAGAFDKTVFTSDIGRPDPIALDADGAKKLIAAAVPGQHLIADTDWGPADRVFDYAVGDLRPDTSVRIVSGLFPRPAALRPITGGLYDQAAAFWVITPDGRAVRVSTTDPASWERLQQLALDIVGGATASTSPTSTVVATTTTVDPAGDQEGSYYTTMSPMVMWPDVFSSAVAPGTTGFGMALCSGGSWTKYSSLQSVDREWHAYQGTLCIFTTLKQPIAEAVASCSSMSTGTNYARCQRRPVASAGAPPTEGATTHDTVTREGPANTELLPSTPPDAPQIFGDRVSAAASPDEPRMYSEGNIQVVLWAGTTAGETCFSLESTYVSSTGCLGPTLLSTGLAYGAFVEGDASPEIVGIVPDDVTTVEIAGTTIAVQGNVWHYTAHPGDDLSFTVFSADHSISAALAPS